jgi:hypothetical protein
MRSELVSVARIYSLAPLDLAAVAILTPEEVAHYHARVAQLAPPDTLAWLHPPGENVTAR